MSHPTAVLYLFRLCLRQARFLLTRTVCVGFLLYIHEPLAQPRPTSPQPNYSYQLSLQQQPTAQQQQQRSSQPGSQQQQPLS